MMPLDFYSKQMGTLSFHVDRPLEARIRMAAKRRKLPLSRFLKESVERSLEESTRKGKDLRGIVTGKSDFKPGDTILPPWNESDEPTR
jgi:uncharacterized protein involved in type VI secretion and phage assembly